MRFRVARMRDEEEDPSVESRDLSFCIKERMRPLAPTTLCSRVSIMSKHVLPPTMDVPWWDHMPVWSTIDQSGAAVESFRREVIEQLAAAGPALEVHLAIVQRLAARAGIKRFSGDAAKLIWQYVMLQAAALLVRATTPVRELVFPQRVHEKRVDDGLSEASEEEEEMGLSDYENDGVDDFDYGGDDDGDNGDGGDDDDGGGGDNGDACETEVECEAVYDGSTKPRRAQTAFNFFSAFARKAVRKEISEAVRISGLRAPEISEDDLKSAVQQSWNMLAAPQRLNFEEKEAADLVRFQQQTKVFEELSEVEAQEDTEGSDSEQEGEVEGGNDCDARWDEEEGEWVFLPSTTCFEGAAGWLREGNVRGRAPLYLGRTPTWERKQHEHRLELKQQRKRDRRLLRDLEYAGGPDSPIV